jgi:hypothetical protein
MISAKGSKGKEQQVAVEKGPGCNTSNNFNSCNCHNRHVDRNFFNQNRILITKYFYFFILSENT